MNSKTGSTVVFFFESQESFQEKETFPPAMDVIRLLLMAIL